MVVLSIAAGITKTSDFKPNDCEKLALLKGYDIAVSHFKKHVEAQRWQDTVAAPAFETVLQSFGLLRKHLEQELNK